MLLYHFPFKSAPKNNPRGLLISALIFIQTSIPPRRIYSTEGCPSTATVAQPTGIYLSDLIPSHPLGFIFLFKPICSIPNVSVITILTHPIYYHKINTARTRIIRSSVYLITLKTQNGKCDLN